MLSSCKWFHVFLNRDVQWRHFRKLQKKWPSVCTAGWSAPWHVGRSVVRAGALWWIQGVKGRKKFENIHFVLNFCIKLCFSVYGFGKTWYLDPSFLGGGCKKKHLRFGSQWLESSQQEEEIQGAVNHLSYENFKVYFEPKICNHSTLKHSSVNQDQL